jgi:hypothetical protein
VPPPPPTCPTGQTLNPATGKCEPAGDIVVPPEEKKGLSTGAIVAGAVGLAALAGVVALAATSGKKKPGRRTTRRPGAKPARKPSRKPAKRSKRSKKR